MAQYLGETPVNIADHPEFKTHTPADWAMVFITLYGGIDGAHHKTWVLDQVSRILKGTPVLVSEARWDNGESNLWFNTAAPSEAYLQWRKELRDPDTGEDYYDEGIAP